MHDGYIWIKVNGKIKDWKIKIKIERKSMLSHSSSSNEKGKFDRGCWKSEKPPTPHPDRKSWKYLYFSYCIINIRHINIVLRSDFLTNRILEVKHKHLQISFSLMEHRIVFNLVSHQFFSFVSLKCIFLHIQKIHYSVPQ